MATGKRGLVDKVKRVVARASTRGAMTLVEGTAAAVRTVDKLQSKLSTRGKKAKAAVMPEAPMVGVSPPVASEKQATPARRAPQARDTAASAPPRTAGRKTLPVTEAAAKRSTAPATKTKKAAAKKPMPQTGNTFKVKRGQKHLHSGR